MPDVFSINFNERLNMKYAYFLLFALGFSITANAASFDCKKASYPDEKIICSDRIINDLDVEMATKYNFLKGLFAMGNRGAMMDDQSSWIKMRHACKTDKSCIKKLYSKRINELDSIYDKIEKPL